MQSISPFPSLAIAPAQLDVWDYIAAEEIPVVRAPARSLAYDRR
jgi:hypothetical protein